MSHKKYMGDAVYADFDGYHIILTTENGIRVTNSIALEPTVFDALTRYHAWLQACYASKEAPP
ncbi:MAG: hypothetical protein E4H01_08660 [Lysobacterales bacterium]|nr:MAG: hypothetical protein E4H01_08660 [Xanthomonadales bacterium]